MAVKVTSPKTITLCSVYLLPRSHLNFNPQTFRMSFSFYSPNFKELNNRGQLLEDLILKNYLILFIDKSHTYFYSANVTFTSIDLTLSSPSLFIDFSWKVGSDTCGSDHFPILLENDGPPSLEREQRWKVAKAN